MRETIGRERLGEGHDWVLCLEEEAWKRRHGYGQRWMVESTFSSLKRTFGEYVSAKTMRNMANEIILKASLYNLLTTLAITPNTRRKSLERTRQEPVMQHNTHEGNLIFEANSLTTWFFKWNL